jgi:hypothetical protein
MTNTNDTGGVRVKPLEWVDRGTWTTADCLLGRYEIDDVNGRWHALGPSGFVSRGHASIPEAKAAAQADYEARILSAIEPPKPEVAGLDERGIEALKNDLLGVAAVMQVIGSGQRTMNPAYASSVAELLERASAYLSAASQDGEKAVAWMHPATGWVDQYRANVAMHCTKDGPQPVPLYLAPPTPEAGKYADGVRAAAQLVAGLRDDSRIEPMGFKEIVQRIEVLLQPDSKARP